MRSSYSMRIHFTIFPIITPSSDKEFGSNENWYKTENIIIFYDANSNIKYLI